MMNNFDENYIIELVKKELSRYLTDQGIEIKKEVRRVFISAGGTDNYHVITHLLKQMEADEWRNVEKAFYDSLSLCTSLLGTYAFRQPPTKADNGNEDIKFNPISLSLFESMMWSVSQLSESERSRLLERKKVYVAKYTEMFEDEALRKYLSNGTNNSQSVVYRFMAMQKLVSDVLNG